MAPSKGYGYSSVPYLFQRHLEPDSPENFINSAILLEGDMQVGGTDVLLLEGDAGSDQLLLEGSIS